MLQVPRFRSHLTVETVKEDTVLFSTDCGSFALKGRLLVLLAPFINGRNSSAKIAEQLRGILSPGSVQFGLYCLQQTGVLVEAAGAELSRLERDADLLNLDFETTKKRLAQRSVFVTALGGASADGVKKAMESLGLNLDEDCEIKVVVVQDYLLSGLEASNRQSLQSRKPWMLVKPYGGSIWWGPLFVPGRTACWRCLAERMKENVWSEHLSRLVGSSVVCSGTRAHGLTDLVDAGMNLAALSLFRWIVDSDCHNLEGRIYALDGRSMQLTEHQVQKIQHCPECGGKKAPKKHFINFGDAQGPGESEPWERRCSLEKTFGRLEKHISPITGIVGSIEPVFEKDEIPVYVYSTGGKFGLGERPDWFPESYPIPWCSGRGTSRIEAKTAALCEALERYSGVFRGSEVRRLSTFKNMGPAAFHPNSLMHFSAGQFSKRLLQDKSGRIGSWIPEPLDEDLEIEWTPVCSLTGDQQRYVPTAYCYYAYPDRTGTRFCKADSNGNAGGNSLEEAIVHGFLELVERDCVAIWWYNRIPRAGIDLETFDSPWFRKITRYYQSLDREITILEITSDLEIPTFAAISRSNHGDLSDLTIGFGASFDAPVAIRRALLEMNQLIPLVLAGEPTTSLTGLPAASESKDFWLRPAIGLPLKTASDLSGVGDEAASTDLERCRNVAESHGLEIFFLDQTREETELAVAKVLVPSLRPWWPRFGPGRLYDLPIQMKWLDEPVPEEALNPAWLSL